MRKEYCKIMFKSVQVRIILIIMILAILMLIGYGTFSIQTMKATNISEKMINENILIIIAMIVSFIIISAVTIWFTSKIITKPIYKLIKRAKSSIYYIKKKY